NARSTDRECNAGNDGCTAVAVVPGGGEDAEIVLVSHREVELHIVVADSTEQPRSADGQGAEGSQRDELIIALDVQRHVAQERVEHAEILLDVAGRAPASFEPEVLGELI